MATIAPARAQTPPTELPGARVRRAIPEDRFAMAGGCYTLRTGGAAFRFQATDLGRYLLFTTDGKYLAGGSDGTVTPANAASNDADWVVDGGAGRFTLRLTSPDRTLVSSPSGDLATVAGAITTEAAQFNLARASGCPPFPDAEVNVSGPHARGATAIEDVKGYVDGHLHMMAFEYFGGRAHCGRPWHRFGAPAALVDCPDHGIANGNGAVLENILSKQLPIGGHDTVGWPTFNDWPAYSSLTHEQVYYRWLERAWRGGLRMFVNLFVENGVLCEIYPLKKNSCNEMDSVRLQAQRIHELERYIDAQSGGPGRGWFRIVTDPFEARRVMNEGRLAVVLGIEVSELFGCTLYLDQPQCTTADIDRQVDEMYALGVRQMELVNKFDNALTGVAGDGGTFGMIVNGGNFYSTGQFWRMQHCDDGDTGVHDNDQLVLPGGLADQDSIFGAVLQAGVPPSGTVPIYPAPHHCNPRGLTDLGKHTIERMIERGMVFDPDHMSVVARQQSLTVLEAHNYHGVISSHSWATPDAYPRIYKLGGMTTPYAGSSTGFVREWKKRRPDAARVGRECVGFGYGADSNGLGSQGSPRGPGAKDPVTYPFTGLGGAVIRRQVSGARTYDVNLDGVAHYGLYPDWIEDLRHLGGQQIIDDMSCGADNYLQVWETAMGIAPVGCRSPAALDALPSGLSASDVLRRVGQPTRRAGSDFTFCLTGGGSRVLHFDATNRLLAGAPAADVAPLAVTGRQPTVPLGAIGAALLLALAARRRRRAYG